MRDVYDLAKYFIKSNLESMKNTYDGNMKLQKLLVLADVANIAEYGEHLFQDNILAYKNGCVVEKVRNRYKYDYKNFINDSKSFEPSFSEQEYYVLNAVNALFGRLDAKELSKINHTFNFWKELYDYGTNEYGYHDKGKPIVDMDSHPEDIDKMKEVLAAYKESSSEESKCEEINGIMFYYDGFEMTDSIMEQLESFSLIAEDNSYSVCFDNGNLAIF